MFYLNVMRNMLELPYELPYEPYELKLVELILKHNCS